MNHGGKGVRQYCASAAANMDCDWGTRPSPHFAPTICGPRRKAAEIMGAPPVAPAVKAATPSLLPHSTAEWGAPVCLALPIPPGPDISGRPSEFTGMRFMLTYVGARDLHITLFKIDIGIWGNVSSVRTEQLKYGFKGILHVMVRFCKWNP